MTTTPNVTLTIAGNDASGGAGIGADLKTFAEYGTFGIATLTVIATMDPDTWKHGVTPVDIQVVQDQLDTALSIDKGIDALKTGMLPTFEHIELVARYIKDYNLNNFVLDPVMVCKGDNEVLNPALAEGLRDLLTPLATVATPNLFEAGQLSGLGELKTLDSMKEAAQRIHQLGAAYVVVKGGQTIPGDQAIDVLYDGKDWTFFKTAKLNDGANHGAGCTFAAAITAGLANGLAPKEAIFKAKDFVSAGIAHGFNYNQFVAPVFHSAKRLTNHDASITEEPAH